MVPVFLPSLRHWFQARRAASIGRMSISFAHDHVGISVTPEDLEATIEWYSSSLGFTVDQRFDSHGTTFVYIVSGDVKIELLAGAANRQAPTDDVLKSMDPSRLHHFCVAVQDLDAAVAELRDLDVELIGGPMEVAQIGQRIAFVADNLGNIIELAEPGTWPADRSSSANSGWNQAAAARVRRTGAGVATPAA
ncbi:VOC family protein [Actinomadura rudentiformis]|nr:VOC family protein [Actinomadura rudentiformis]